MNNVKDFRIKKGLTQEKLARICDVTLNTIQNIENKNYNPKVDLAIKIKKALNTDIEELFPPKED